jgi:hypothetical protein
MKALVFNKTIAPGVQFIAYRTVSDIWTQGHWLPGHSEGSVELRHEQNINKFDFSDASFANVFANCFKAKLPAEIEFCFVCAEYLVSGLKVDIAV